MRFTKLWSRLAGSSKRPAPLRAKKKPTSLRFTPVLSTLEDRTVLNGYLAVGAGPGFLPEVAIRVDIQDQIGGSPPNNAGQPPTPRSDGVPETTDQIFMAYNPLFRGGINVATGNFDGDSTTPDSLITAPKAGGGPHVIIWNTRQNADGTIVVTGIKQQFMAFDPGFTGGVNITTGDLDGDGKDELIVAAGPGGGPHVKIYSPDAKGDLVLVDQFFAYSAAFHGGVSVASTQGYGSQVQVRQVLNAQLPTGFVETPYPAGDTVPGSTLGYPLISSALAIPGTNGDAPVGAGGMDPDTGQTVPAGNPGSLDANNIPLPYITVGAGALQYLSGDFLNSYGAIAYRPSIFGQPAPVGTIVSATWADTTAMSNYPTDGSNPPVTVPVGPYVVVAVLPDGTDVVTRLTDAPGQVAARDQLVTGAGPGGGPHVEVWGFNGTGATLTHFLGTQFFAFPPSFHGGVNVAVGTVISDPVPAGQGVVDPLSPDFTQNPVTLSLPETTGNTDVQQVTPTGYPIISDLDRRYTPDIIVGMASGGADVRIFADDNPDVTDPNNPFSDPAPSQRTSLFQLDMVPALIGTTLATDPTNPLGGYVSFGTTTDFNHAIDPQFNGGVNITQSAFTFGGTANEVLTGVNVAGGAGFVTNPVLGQTVFSVGNSPTTGSSRGSLVQIFNQMSTLTQTSPYYSPAGSFAGFTSYSGLGVTTAYGFGALPNAGLDIVTLPQATLTNVTNPVLV